MKKVSDGPEKASWRGGRTKKTKCDPSEDRIDAVALNKITTALALKNQTKIKIRVHDRRVI